MRGNVLKLNELAFRNIVEKGKESAIIFPHYAYTHRCLQGFTAPKSSTFGFLQTLISAQQKPKELDGNRKEY